VKLQGPFIRLAALLLMLCGCAGALAQPKPASVPTNVGGVELSLPLPAGYSTVPPSQPLLARLGENITPPSNRLLEFFISRDDIASLGLGTPIMARYFLVQTVRAVEGRVLSPEEFAQIRAVFRNQQAEVSKRLEPQKAELARGIGENVSRDLGARIDLKIGDVVPLGIYEDTERYFSLGLMSRVQAQMGTRTDAADIVCVTTVLHARGKALFLYAYSRFNGPADVEWAKQASRAWTSDFLKLNP
jgi:hypothetical protein